MSTWGITCTGCDDCAETGAGYVEYTDMIQDRLSDEADL